MIPAVCVGCDAGLWITGRRLQARGADFEDDEPEEVLCPSCAATHDDPRWLHRWLQPTQPNRKEVRP